MEWYLKVIKNYTGFQGRARRKEYWMFMLVNTLIMIALEMVLRISHLPTALADIYSLAVLLPSLAVEVRRLHDTGRSGWWILLSLIPVIGVIILIVFFCQDSRDAGNKYGPNPKRNLNLNL